MKRRSKALVVGILLITLGQPMIHAAGDSSADQSVRLCGSHDKSAIAGLSHGNGIYVAVGQAGMILTSFDGVEWTRQQSGNSRPLYSIAFGNGTFVAVGSEGTILVSTDGVNWINRRSSDYPCLRSVAFGNGTFVTVGSHGRIFSSTDARTWLKRESGVSVQFRSITQGNGTFVVVGESGVVLSSADGATWVKRESGTNRNLNRVAFELCEFVAAGSGDTVLTSADGVTWESSRFPFCKVSPSPSEPRDPALHRPSPFLPATESAAFATEFPKGIYARGRHLVCRFGRHPAARKTGRGGPRYAKRRMAVFEEDLLEARQAFMIACRSDAQQVLCGG